MQQLKKKMKVLIDDPGGIDYLQKNSYLSVQFNELRIQASNIARKLQRLSQLESDLPEMIEQRVKEKITPLLEENRTLKSQLEEKIQPVEKYEVQIKELQSQIENLKKQITDFSNKVKVLEKTNQELQDRKKDLETTITDEEEINQIYDKLGTFKKIRNKLRIIELWEGNPEKVLRQIEILYSLEGQMGVGSIKQYIKEMIRGKLLSRTTIQGSYTLSISDYCDFKLDCDKLCELLLGSVYETGVQIRMEKIKSERDPEY